MSPRHDIFKTTAFFISSEKPRDMFGLIARTALLVCLFTSITLVLYVSFSNRPYPFKRFTSMTRKMGAEPPAQPPDNALTNISHLLFGIAGSTKTWRQRRAFSSLWWDVETTRGFFWLDKEPEDNKAVTGYDTKTIISLPYRISGQEWTRFKYSDSRHAIRIARVIRDSFNLKLPNVRWFVMGDDDTIFFTQNLVSVLGRYDHNEMWYIGGHSESVEQNVVHAYMAFGGGGFAISYPLAEKLVNALDGCLERYYYFYGSDQRIQACITEIGVPLTTEPGFHQFDIRGDVYGLLAAHPMAPLISFHHLDTLIPLFPNQTRIGSLRTLFKAYQLDPGRILQQSICYDSERKWSMVISWGYTIQVYPWLVTAYELQMPLQTFKTWGTRSNGPFMFNTRSMPNDACEWPIVYFMDQVEEVGSSGTKTTYKFALSEESCNRSDYASVMSVANIVVSSMKMPPDYWQKAPHRQCCEIMDVGGIEEGSMQVRIRNCRKFETTSV
ncbi:hypothetical protein PTKIN_Ptkin16aG0515100 [Pterospermum kingtungense]